MSIENENLLLAIERTRLASERTFLSWIRTGITGVGLGVAMVKLILFNNAEHQFIADLIGKLLILWGIAVFIFSLFSYWQSYKSYQFQTKSRNSFIGITLLTSILIIFSLLLFMIVG